MSSGEAGVSSAGAIHNHPQGAGHSSHATSRAAPPRIAYLDAIRALAILAVMAVHLGAPAVGHKYLLGGYIGVDVFYVLSGFIITRLLFARHSTYISFVISRARRLLPALAAAIIVGLALAMIYAGAVSRLESLRSAAAALTMTSPLVLGREGPGLAPFPVMWSLAIEWYFYLLWPLIVSRASVRALRLYTLPAAGAIFLASATFLPTWWFYFGPASRFAQMLIGCWLATLKRPSGGVLISRVLCLIAVGALSSWVLFGPVESSASYRWIGFPLATASGATLVWFGLIASNGDRARWLRPLAWLGAISYSVYLWHDYFHSLLPGRAIVGSIAATTVVSLILGLSLSVASYYLVEKRRKRSERGAIFPSLD